MRRLTTTSQRRRTRRYDERRQRLLRQHEYGHLADDELRNRIEQIERERAQDEEQLATLNTAGEVGDVDRARLVEAEQLCRQAEPRLRRLDFKERRRLIEKLVRRVILDGTDVTVEVIVPLLPAPKVSEEVVGPAVGSAG